MNMGLNLALQANKNINNTSLNLMRARINHNNKQQGLIAVTSSRKSNYLQEHGVFPVKKLDDTEWYCRTPKLLQLLEDYELQFTFKNKL